MIRVKNISGVTQEVVGYGIVEADATISVSEDFHNANFVEEKEPKPIKKEAKE